MKGLVALLSIASCLVNGCTFDQNTDYQGNDLKPLQSPHVANVTACCDLCSATPGAASAVLPAVTLAVVRLRRVYVYAKWGLL